MSDTSTKFSVQDEDQAIGDEELATIREACDEIRAQVSEVYVGSPEVVDALLVAMLSGGHILMEGVPGVAKTTLCRAFAATLGARFRRIQFTPDLLPADITGNFVPDLQQQRFELRRGPVFANIVLGDEINRAPAKTQAALLEAMQERQVTIEGETMELPEPFMVLATQNPVEQQGVYPLPEAQLDRFLMKLRLGYPSQEQEMEVLRRHRQRVPMPEQSVKASEVVEMAAWVEKVHVEEELIEYIVGLVRRTRVDRDTTLGASPRATLALLRVAQAHALLRGRGYVLPDDIRVFAAPVLAHRLVLHRDAELEGLSQEEVVGRALKKVSYAKTGRERG